MVIVRAGLQDLRSLAPQGLEEYVASRDGRAFLAKDVRPKDGEEIVLNEQDQAFRRCEGREDEPVLPPKRCSLRVLDGRLVTLRKLTPQRSRTNGSLIYGFRSKTRTRSAGLVIARAFSPRPPTPREAVLSVNDTLALDTLVAVSQRDVQRILAKDGCRGFWYRVVDLPDEDLVTRPRLQAFVLREWTTLPSARPLTDRPDGWNLLRACCRSPRPSSAG